MIRLETVSRPRRPDRDHNPAYRDGGTKIPPSTLDSCISPNTEEVRKRTRLHWIINSFRRPKRPKKPKRLQIPIDPNPLIDRTQDPAMGNLVFGSVERPGNPIGASKILIVRDNDVAIGQGARPTKRPDEHSAQTASAALHRTRDRKRRVIASLMRCTSRNISEIVQDVTAHHKSR